MLLVGIIAIQFVQLTTKHAYSINISEENYQPIVMSKAIVIIKQLIDDGAKVKKNQPVVHIRFIQDNGDASPTQHMMASANGVYFHSQVDSPIIKPYQPIGYLLKYNLQTDYLFWLTEQPNKPVKVGSLVILMIENREIKGRVSTVIGSHIEGKGQKISIKFDNNNSLHLLSPLVSLKVILAKQSKTVVELLR